MRRLEKQRWPMGRVVAALAGLFVAAAMLVVVAPAHAPQARADVTGQGGDFVPFDTPQRLLDTRNGTGGITGPLTGGSVNSFPVLGRAGVPTTNVRAVLLNVATVAPTARTYLELWPDGTARPTVSMQNVDAGQTLSNTAVVAPGANGSVSIYNDSGSVNAVVDVEGYFTVGSGGPGGEFVPVTQTRLVDTRSGLGAPQAPIPAHGSLTVTLATSPVPATANAVFVSVTVPGVSANGSGYLSAYPAGGTDGNPVKNFTSGDTAAGASLKLGTNGAVTFVNHSGGSVNVVLDVQGYFTQSSTEGAGLRIATGRLINTKTAGTPIPADGSIDVSVGGTNGLPTIGIAGAVLNFTVLDQTATQGFIRASSVGSPEQNVSLANFVTGGIRSHNAIIAPGTEGKIRVHNVSGGTINLVVDLQGWFADPIPPVPVDQYAPVAAVQASPLSVGTLGAMEYAYVDNIGVLRHGHQISPNDFTSIQWTAISGNEAFTGRPGLLEQADGKLHVVAHNTDSNVWVNTEATKDPLVWGSWVSQGGSMSTHPVVVRQSDSTLVAFATNSGPLGGQLWEMTQNGVNGPYGSWQSLGRPSLPPPPQTDGVEPLVTEGLTDTPTAVVVGTQVKLFGVDNIDGSVMMATYAGGVLSDWTSLGGTGVTGSPAVVVLPGGKLRVFVRAGDGSIQTKIQDDLGVFPDTWDTVAGLTAAGSPAAILSPITATTEVVVRGTDGIMYSTGETAPASGAWRSWAQASGTGMASDPTVFEFTSANGPDWAFVVQRTAGVPIVFTVTPPGGLVAQSTETQKSAVAPSFAEHALPAPPR